MGVYQSVRTGAAPTAKTVLMKSGFYSALRQVSPSRKVAILRYHAVCDPHAGYADPAICVPPAAFQRQVECLAADYTVLPLPEVVDAFGAGRSLPPNTVVITFDDGYADNLQAARMLHRHGLSATFYITADCLAGGSPFWPAELRALISAIRQPSVTLNVGERAISLALTTDMERGDAVRRITRLFKSHPIPVRERLRDQLRSLASGVPDARVMLTWEELAEMHRLGMTIGAHTLTHPNLPSAGLDAAALEIRGSKQRLEKELDTSVTMFSYPNGGAERYYTPELQKIVREAGFRAAATSRNGFASAKSDPFALERVQVAERLEDLLFTLEVERFVFAPRSK
jgi:peptidoglycan/xylan/chitin deacetylase (PgdA/CDA1 family)